MGAVATAKTPSYRGVFLASVWTFTGFGATLTVMGPLLQPIRETFARGQAEMGLVFLVASAAYIIAVMAGTTASDHYGRRPFVLAGPAFILAGFVIAAVSPTWTVFLAGAFVFGLGMGLVDGSLNALVIDVSKQSAASALNYLHLFFGVGAVIGPLMVGVALDAGFHWRWIAGATSVLSLTMLLPYLFVRFPPMAQITRPPARRVLAALLRPQPLLMMAVILFYVGMEATYSGWLPSYFEIEFGSSRGVAAYSVATTWVGIVVGRGLSGLAARYVDHHVLIFTTIGASVATGFLVVVAGSIPLAFAALAGTGILIGGSFPTALAIGVRGQPAMVGALTGFIVAGAGLAGMIFPPLTGLVVEGLGFKAAMVLPALLAIPAAVAAAAAFYVQRRGRSRDLEAARTGDH